MVLPGEGGSCRFRGVRDILGGTNQAVSLEIPCAQTMRLRRGYVDLC